MAEIEKYTHEFGLFGVAPHQVEPGHKSVTLIMMLLGAGGKNGGFERNVLIKERLKHRPEEFPASQL
jgi:hypothetical protein